VPRLPDHVLGIQYEWTDRRTIVLHNFSELPTTVRVRVEGIGPCPLVNMLSQERGEPDEGGQHTIDLEPYGYRWLRAGDTERPLTDGQPRRR
jgi:maltose alpha-D-glucosyltransferase/alpha-amylase